MNTSATLSIRCSSAASLPALMSRTSDSFPRLSHVKYDDSPLTARSYPRAKSPSARSILITRAPASARRHDAIGAATACSSATTRSPARGPSDTRADMSERPWQSEHVLGDEAQDQVRRYRRDLIQARFAE